MTAPGREALAGRARAQAIDLRACNALPRHHRDTQDEIDAAADILDEIAALIEALSAPAVTVTEEMVEELRTISGSASSAAWHRNYATEKSLWRLFDAKLDAIKAALKSTTPQTGSRE